MAKITLDFDSSAVTIMHGDAVVTPGEIDLPSTDELLISPSSGGWSVMVMNTGAADDPEVKAVVHDDVRDYEIHHLKPRGGWSLGWSVSLVGDPGDSGTISVFS